MKTLFCIFFLSALAGSVSGEELSYPFETGEQGAKAQFDVKPGCAYRLDYEWREVDVPRRAYLMPHLRVVDTNGAVVLDRNVGMIQHRAFAPDDPSVQRWQVMAIVNDADRPASTAGFEGLATVKLPAGSARMTLSVSRFGEAAKVADERLRATPVSGVPRALPVPGAAAGLARFRGRAGRGTVRPRARGGDAPPGRRPHGASRRWPARDAEDLQGRPVGD